MKKLLLSLCLLFAFQTLSSKIYFRHLGASDGLSQLSVMCIAQDELGRMWFGTMEGLNCYDGNRILSYKASEKYPFLGNQIFNMASDRKGNLFFTSDGVLIRYDLHADKFLKLNRTGKVTALHAANGNVYMAASDSVFVWEDKQQTFDLIYAHANIRFIQTLAVDNNGILWIGTRNGLYRVDNHKTQPQKIISGTIRSIYPDSHKNIWVAMMQDGAFRITERGIPERIAVGKEALSDKDVRTFTEDGEGNIWIATFNGLNKIDRQGHFTYYKEDILPGSLQHSSVFSLYRDVQGTIWLGTYYGGVHFFNPEIDFFAHYMRGIERDDCLSYSFIGKMVEDKHGNIWVFTGGKGLDKLNRRTGQFTHYISDGTSGTIPFNSLMSIAYDEKHDRIYVGTYSKGLFSLDVTTNEIRHFRDFGYYGSSVIHLEMHGTQLYMLTTKGMFTMDTNAGTIRHTMKEKGFRAQGNTFFIDSQNRLWMAQNDRLLLADLDTPGNVRIYPCNQKGLGKFPISKITEDKNGNIYLGTIGNGLFRYNPQQDSFLNYTAEDGWLQSNYCYDIALNENNYLIIAESKGLTILNLDKKEVKNIGLKDKLLLSALNEGCGVCVCRDGTVFASGVDGMASFAGNKVFEPFPPYTVYFSALTVNNRPVPIGNKSILKVPLPYTSRIDLKHDENNITVTFASNNYIPYLQQQRYEYKLEGFDKEWITASDKKITYTNLNPGHYELLLREPQGNLTQLQLVVHAPWYATWLAYFVYGAIALSIAFIVIKNRQTKMRLKHSLEIEKMEKAKNEEVTQAKLQFFADISHEFRTPLTLIISQLEMLLQHKRLSLFVYTRLFKIYKNTFQLRDLISELLDFRKIERGGMHLKVSRMNLIPFLRTIYTEFQDFAALQHIQFSFQAHTETVMCWFDAKQLRRIFLNLLSNAFKYTDKDGKIDMVVEETANAVTVKIIDTGKGISKEDVSHIFDRFFQADHSSCKESGTGIGLALAKGLVDLHHGSINVQSALGYGSIFAVSLPLDDVFKDDKNAIQINEEEQKQRMASVSMQQPIKKEELSEEHMAEEPDEHPASETTRILIVEDNEELLSTLSDLLSPYYKISIALNGKDGLDKAVEEQPDLILSDVIMPVMNGTEMCTKIKNDFNLCHIPVVLLTALTSEDKELKGLQCGADDYIGKPFSNKVLLGRIASILHNRNLLRKKFNSLTGEKHAELQNIGLTAIDRNFLTKLDKSIENHLADSEFDINTLAAELGVSRTSLYKKIKALSNMTPGEYVLKAKLDRAAELLKSKPELQITEIAYQVGFSSLRYFRHCFKALYNKTPQEYRKA